jgi:hypothetical protein
MGHLNELSAMTRKHYAYLENFVEIHPPRIYENSTLRLFDLG